MRTLAADRAQHRCEYCRLPELADPYGAFHLEHIVAKQHGGTDDFENLAWSCSRCNRREGTNLTTIDPATTSVVELFHPRRHAWDDHFQVLQATIVGVTPIGRATVRILDMNARYRVRLRRELIQQGAF